MYDVAVIGSGASGILSAITAARAGRTVLLLEKMESIALKLKASGGGKCNLTNTLDTDQFIDSFGKQAKFMRDALNIFSSSKLLNFLDEIGLKTHSPDGFRVFPLSHDSKSVVDALQNELIKRGVDIKCKQSVKKVSKRGEIFTIKTDKNLFRSKNIILATGGMGYEMLGTCGDGYEFAKSLGHSVSELHPAMLPLHLKQKWVKNCRADTIAKVTLKVNLPKMNRFQKIGDLIFTTNGIRGPVVLDFATIVTPLLKKYERVPILANLTKGMNEEDIRLFLKAKSRKRVDLGMEDLIGMLLPKSVSRQFCHMLHIEGATPYHRLEPKLRDTLIKILAWTPFDVVGHDGFKRAMVTKGGVKLKEINPKTMQSKIAKGLYFCGEIVDLDGACGGYNLQWAFSSGFLAGCLKD